LSILDDFIERFGEPVFRQDGPGPTRTVAWRTPKGLWAHFIGDSVALPIGTFENEKVLKKKIWEAEGQMETPEGKAMIEAVAHKLEERAFQKEMPID
jgi:hypothetical protein